MIFNEIKCHVNTSLGLVGGCIPPVSAPGGQLLIRISSMTEFLERDK